MFDGVMRSLWEKGEQMLHVVIEVVEWSSQGVVQYKVLVTSGMVQLPSHTKGRMVLGLLLQYLQGQAQEKVQNVFEVVVQSLQGVAQLEMKMAVAVAHLTLYKMVQAVLVMVLKTSQGQAQWMEQMVLGIGKGLTQWQAQQMKCKAVVVPIQVKVLKDVDSSFATLGY